MKKKETCLQQLKKIQYNYSPDLSLVRASIQAQWKNDLTHFIANVEVFPLLESSDKFKATNLFQVLVLEKQNITVIFVVPPAHNVFSPGAPIY